MVLLKSRIILMYDVLGISSKTMATLKSSVFVCLQRLCPGVCSKGLPERSLDTELAGGCVAGRIRNTQCSRLLVGHFFWFLAWVFFPLEIGVKKKRCSRWSCSSPEPEEPSHFSGVIKTIHELVASTTVVALHCYDRPVQFSHGQASAATWFRWLCRWGALQCWGVWFRSMLNFMCFLPAMVPV